MDPNQQPGHQTVIVNQPESNSLGLAGFIVSLAGWITCGLLCPIGLILSLFALGKRPRGFAIAGVILGLPGVLFLAFFGFVFLMTVLGIGAAATAAAALAQQSAEIASARGEINTAYSQTSVLPDEATAQALFVTKLEWDGEVVRYIRESDTQYTLVAPGIDGAFDTADDFRQTWSVDGSLVREQKPEYSEFGSP